MNKAPRYTQKTLGLNHNSPVILQLNSLQPGELLLNAKQPSEA
jgi:hypothetical protein